MLLTTFRLFIFITLTLSLSALQASPTSPALSTTSPSPAPRATDGDPQVLIVTGLHGYIEPCGCTIDLTLGSIERLAYQIKALKKKGPTAVLIAGGHLFEQEEVPEHRHAQDEAKARLLRELLSELEVDALMPHAIDLALGEELYRSINAAHPERDPTVNIEGGQPLLLTLGALKVGVLGIGAEGARHPNGGVLLSPLPAAKAAAALLKAQGAQVIIALSTLPRSELRTLAEALPELELVALAEGAMESAALSPVGPGRYLIEAGDRGRNLAVLKLTEATEPGPLLDPEGDRARRIKDLELRLKMRRQMGGFGGFGRPQGDNNALERELAQLKSAEVSQTGKRLTYSLIPISSSLPVDVEVEAKVKTYQRSLKALNLASATGPVPLPEGGNGYGQIKECALCHPGAKTFWEGTAHARAWETLEKAEKTFDVECVSCHVTGFQAPGGSSLGHTEGLQDVQCEACHGPSAQHAEVGGGESGTRLKVTEEVCRGCHNELHSPKFSYADYLKKVLGPGHGAPLPVQP